MKTSVPREKIIACVERAIDRLLVNDAELLDIEANERSISHRLAVHLEREFEGWDVDCEYNRNMEHPKMLVYLKGEGFAPEAPPQEDMEGTQAEKIYRDIQAKTVYPDIIVHRRLTEENLVVIEMKKGDLCTDNDKAKLRAFTKPPFDYEVGLLLVVDRKKVKEKKWYSGGEWRPDFESGKRLEKRIRKDLKGLGYGE